MVVRVVGEGGRSAGVEAVIDTGFDGHLLLPPSVVSSLSLPRIGSARPTLADGSVVVMTVHVAEVLWTADPARCEYWPPGKTLRAAPSSAWPCCAAGGYGWTSFPAVAFWSRSCDPPAAGVPGRTQSRCEHRSSSAPASFICRCSAPGRLRPDLLLGDRVYEARGGARGRDYARQRGLSLETHLNRVPIGHPTRLLT